MPANLSVHGLTEMDSELLTVAESHGKLLQDMAMLPIDHMGCYHYRWSGICEFRDGVCLALLGVRRAYGEYARGRRS